MVHIPLNIYIRGESRTVGMCRHFNETVGSTEAHSAHRIGVGAGGGPGNFWKNKDLSTLFSSSNL